MRGIDVAMSPAPTRLSIAVILAAVLTLLVAACAGSSSTVAARSNRDGSGALAFAQCMRSHGMPDWPDPDSHGNFPTANPAASPTLDSAEHACGHLWHYFPSAAKKHQIGLYFARCMRRSGFPNTPDSGNLSYLPKIVKDSEKFTSAVMSCANAAHQRVLHTTRPWLGLS